LFQSRYKTVKFLVRLSLSKPWTNACIRITGTAPRSKEPELFVESNFIQIYPILRDHYVRWKTWKSDNIFWSLSLICIVQSYFTFQHKTSWNCHFKAKFDSIMNSMSSQCIKIHWSQLLTLLKRCKFHFWNSSSCSITCSELTKN
jgi:hypothetical protein